MRQIKIYSKEEIEEELKSIKKIPLYQFTCDCGHTQFVDIENPYECLCGMKVYRFKIVEEGEQ
jgi:hypothetical protein